jgi:hypothetical protein
MIKLWASVNGSTFHDEIHVFQGCDVVNGIAVHGDNVG